MPAVSANLEFLVEERAFHLPRSEFRFKKPNGSWFWFANDARAIHDAEGRLIAIEGILTDITERNRAQCRDVILETVAASAKELLRASDLQQSLPRVIERLGQATGVDRAHIFEVDTSTPASPCRPALCSGARPAFRVALAGGGQRRRHGRSRGRALAAEARKG